MAEVPKETYLIESAVQDARKELETIRAAVGESRGQLQRTLTILGQLDRLANDAGESVRQVGLQVNCAVRGLTEFVKTEVRYSLPLGQWATGTADLSPRS